MTWARFDDTFPGHRKVRRLSDGAFRLHVTAICFVAHDLTDGFVSVEDLDEMAAVRRAETRVAELVGRGLWEPVDGGWIIHDYLHYNPAKAQVEAERQASRERQKRRREARLSASSHGVTNGVTPPEATADVPRESHPPDPTRPVPDPTRPVSKEPLVAQGSATRGAEAPEPTTATLVAEWIDHCTDRPPSRVIGQLSREVKTLLDEGIPYDVVRHSVAAWHRKALHPSSLASVVHEVRNPRTAGNGTTRPTSDQRVLDAIDLARRLAEQENAAEPLEIGS